MGISQKELARRAGVSASLVTNLFSNNHVNTRDQGKVGDISDVIESIVEQLVSEGRLSNANKILAEAAVLSLREEFGLIEIRFIAPPGGAISDQSANYIPRIPPPLDRLDTLWPGTLILEGPAQSGVSTSLLAMTREAGKRGINASYYDLDLLAGDLRRRPGLSLRDQVGYVLGMLAEQVWFDWYLEGTTWDSSNQEGSTENALFNSWCRAIEVPSKDSRLDRNRMVFWDHVDHLPSNVAEIMLQGVIGLHHSRIRNPLLPRVCLGISSDRRSPFLTSTLGTRVRIGSFDEAQVQRLVTTTVPDLEDPEPVASMLWKLYGGHPYYTHVASYELRSRGDRSVEDVISSIHAEIVNRRGGGLERG